MAKKQKLSHEEIWDDSALVNSWNEALEEYKHYHSLHARGEKVEDAIQSYGEIQENTDHGQQMIGREASLEGAPSEGRESNALEDGELGKDDANPEVVSVISEMQEIQAPTLEAGTLGNNVPVALMASVHDENLKNLMMSWYYAGYYTGLYEGQQRAMQAPASLK